MFKDGILYLGDKLALQWRCPVTAPCGEPAWAYGITGIGWGLFLVILRNATNER